MQPNYPYPRRTATIPLELVRLEDSSFHLVARVSLDGRKGDMIIDTGASISVVDQQLFPGRAAAGNGVQVQTGSVSGQIEDVRMVEIACLVLGGRKIRHMSLAAIDLGYVNSMYRSHLNRKVIGLLGCDFFVRYRAVIDYRNRTLLLDFGTPSQAMARRG